eukprot:CAMPEP_0182491946 /NCGR_PEP_ID=MMETSP1321-20130603/1215_1 /TAXON_ID=91990 /ORGANISM="Bolidomonas sp., Strain RCC1657" /LENGTH=57 /DNA_ID=CAMNT_0024694307 /DNA_START=54 /DNA_END=227 /DNA_ORIENTATION=+
MPAKSNTKPSHKQSIPETKVKDSGSRNIKRKNNPKARKGGGGGKAEWKKCEDLSLTA